MPSMVNYRKLLVMRAPAHKRQLERQHCGPQVVRQLAGLENQRPSCAVSNRSIGGLSLSAPACSVVEGLGFSVVTEPPSRSIPGTSNILSSPASALGVPTVSLLSVSVLAFAPSAARLRPSLKGNATPSAFGRVALRWASRA